jgi:hypothetical protein
MKAVKRIFAILAILFIAAQFIRPDLTNPAADPALTIHATAQVPPEVASILKRSCFDCHSNETVWPWYSHITPVNWWMVKSHIEHGREHYNFSEWGKKEIKDRDHLLEEICEEVEANAMPLPSYLLAHSDARLSDAQKRAICDWTKAERQRLAQPPPASSETEAPAATPNPAKQ